MPGFDNPDDPDATDFTDFFGYTTGVNNMPNTNLGIQSKVGIGIETTEGVPVKAQRCIDRISGNLEMDLATLKRRAMRAVTASIGAVPGIANINGALVIEPTPEGISKLLCTFLGAPVSTVLSAGTAPATPVGTPSTTGGYLASGTTVYFKTTYVSTAGVEGAASAESTGVATTGGGTTCSISVASPAASTGQGFYNVYASTTAGSEQLQNFIPIPLATPYILTQGPIGSVSYPTRVPPTGTTISQHVWSDTFAAGQLPATISELRGTSLFCFPGARTGSIDVRLQKKQTEPFNMTFNMMAMNQLVYALLSDLGLDTAGFDPLPAMPAVLGALSLNGVISADAESFDLKLNRSLGARDVLNGKRGPNGHYVQESTHSGTATLYFSTENELKRYFGMAGEIGVTGAYGAGDTINYLPINCSLYNDADSTGTQRGFNFFLPNACYTKVGIPVQGPNAIMQTINIEAYHDPTTATSLQISATNSETYSSIITAGTAVASIPYNNVS